MGMTPPTSPATLAVPALGPALVALSCLLAGPALAGDADLVPVVLEVTQPTVWGESVYVTGDLEALGAGKVERAVRMAPVGPSRWRLTVGLPAGTAYAWAPLVRSNDPARLGDPANGRRVGSVVQAVVPGAPALRRVQVRYLSGFPSPRLRYAHGAGDVREAPFRQVGPGRGPGESLWEVTVETALPALEAVPVAADGRVDRAPGGGAYRTTRAAFALVDGEVLPEVPPPARQASRVVVVRDWRSKHLPRPRDIHVYLPRDYDRTARRYPVVYAHDGQNLFGPDALFGGWRVERAADEAIARGQLDDVIVVGVGNTPDRMAEYMPPQEGGRADAYVAFLCDELKPWVDATLRTLPGREHTAVMGSSLGGLVSFYAAWERPDVFGAAASLSGSFWARGHLDAVALAPRPAGLRLWLDSGSAGASADGLEGTLHARDQLLGQGFSLGRDLHHEVALGAGHNEAAWRARVGRVLAWLFPAR